MKLHPRLITGLFCMIFISIAVFVMKKFSLPDDFYYYSLGIILLVAMFLYDSLEKEYKKQDKNTDKPENEYK